MLLKLHGMHLFLIVQILLSCLVYWCRILLDVKICCQHFYIAFLCVSERHQGHTCYRNVEQSRVLKLCISVQLLKDFLYLISNHNRSVLWLATLRWTLLRYLGVTASLTKHFSVNLANTLGDIGYPFLSWTRKVVTCSDYVKSLLLVACDVVICINHYCETRNSCATCTISKIP